jgi:hypothetical protein
MLVLAGIAVPFAEELFFRGVLYAWLRGRWGVWVGVIVSSLIFGLVHLSPVVIIGAIPLGIVTALVYERTKSLWSSVIVHLAFNSLGLLLFYVTLASGVQLPGMS